MPSTPSRGRRIRYGNRSSISSLASMASATSGVSSWSATTCGRRGWRTSRMPSTTSCGDFDSTSRFQLMIASRVSDARGSPRARLSSGDHHSPPTRTSATTMTAIAITRIRDACAFRSLIVSRSASAPHTAPIASRCGSNAASSAGGPTWGPMTRLTTNSTSARTAIPARSRITRAASPWAGTWTNSNPKRPFTHRCPLVTDDSMGEVTFTIRLSWTWSDSVQPTPQYGQMVSVTVCSSGCHVSAARMSCSERNIRAPVGHTPMQLPQ